MDMSSGQPLQLDTNIDLVAQALVPLVLDEGFIFDEQQKKHIRGELLRVGGSAFFEALENDVPLGDPRALYLFRTATFVRPYRMGLSGLLVGTAEESISAVMNQMSVSIPTLVFQSLPETFCYACKERDPMCSINQVLMAGLTVGMLNWFSDASSVREVHFTFPPQPWQHDLEELVGAVVRFDQKNCAVIYNS